ncbi:MAG: DNA polymerase III subunit delta [Chloroflexi bacterium]|nr:MAG: DNA polymerase III subunit delta [Chloroflexota bacterium]
MAVINFHLLRGDDAYSTAQTVKKLTQSLDADFDAAMNSSRLDGKTVSFEDLQMAVTTLPFFGLNRLVVVDSALAKIDKSKQEKFLKLLDSAPESTHLILLVEDHRKWRRDANGSWMQTWETLSPSHWLVKWIEAHENAEIIDLSLPEEKNMDAWVNAEAKRQGGAFDPEAARELAQHTGNDTGIASQEIAKLLTYVDFKRPVNQTDVLECVSVEGSADVFVMLDELVDGKTKQAQSLMRRLLEETPPEAVLGAVIHRFRQLIQVREALDAREDLKMLVDRKVIFSNQIAKYTSAARRFSMPQLEGIFKRLLEMDVQAKTSQVELETNLEMLVLELG